MNDGLLHNLILISALGAGVVAGIFFAFSTFLMKALDRLSPAQAIAAMQSINIVVINPWFLSAFFGTAVACIVLAILSLLDWHRPGAGYLLLGSASYLLGTILVTIACNVPRNNALATVEPTSEDGARLWAGYVRTWTLWNHVRAAAALVAAALFCIALI